MKVLIVIICSFLVSCSAFTLKKDRKDEIHFRYINLKVVFDYFALKDKSIINNMNRRSELLKRLSLQNLSDPEKIKLHKQLNLITKKHVIFKKKSYNIINVALKSYARSDEIDFILNIGEQVVYANKKFDITDEIINKAIVLKRRSSAVSR